MSAQSDILGDLPIAQLAETVGASPEETEAAARSIIPALLGGMEANIQDPGGQQALLGALGDHAERSTDLQDIDVQEGEKIAAHIFGGQEDAVVNQLGGLPGTDNQIVRKLLPILAPIVISYLSKKVLGGGQSTTAAGSGGDILTQILSGVLGGSVAAQAPQAPQAPQADASTSAPQAGTQSAGPNWGDILGGLLGGGTKI